MKIITTLGTILILFLMAGNLSAQMANLPNVRMITDDYDYMISLFPDSYASRQEAVKACSTIIPEAESLKVFWAEQGDLVLYYLSYYAGISWEEPEFKIYLVKYYPDFANFNPMTIPLAGKKDGERIIAVPKGLSLYFTLFQQLARRLLDQVNIPGGTSYHIANHPLLQKSSRRFDVMADLLALRTMADFTSIDSVMAVYKSSHWKKRAPGQEILLNYLWGKWRLSADSTLAALIAAEPYGSKLVALTRPPVTSVPRHSGWGNHQLQPPPGGQIGLSIAKDRSGFYRVVDIDTLKLAYLSGIRRDDLIRNVGGTSPRSIKQFFSLVLEQIDRGAHISIVRNEEPDAVIIYPWSQMQPADSRREEN